MAKLKLVMDALRVESFETTAGAKEKGTVFGEQCSCQSNCNTCPGCPTCDNTCDNTCANTCDDVSCAASCNGTCAGATCDASCYGTCDASCNGTCWNCPNTSLAFPCQLEP